LKRCRVENVCAVMTESVRSCVVRATTCPDTRTNAGYDPSNPFCKSFSSSWLIPLPQSAEHISQAINSDCKTLHGSFSFTNFAMMEEAQLALSTSRNSRRRSRSHQSRMMSWAARSAIAIFLVMQMSSFGTSFQPKSRPIRTNKPHEYANFPSVEEEAPPVSSSFHQRMLMRVKQNDSQRRQRTSSSSSLIQPVRNMEEFKAALNENHDFMVALWTSPWCKACKSLQPAMKALAKHHPNVTFIEIPVLEDNANLHQGLEVPSVPYMHLFLSESQLAEEQKLNRKRLSSVHKMLQDYQQGGCSLERLGQWSTSCPYSYYPVTSLDSGSSMSSSPVLRP
jgi:thiol-disulfide isomerase/thioredoxin